MPVTLTEEHGGKVLHLDVSGKLQKADYANIEPEFERRVGQYGKLWVLLNLHDFHGWERDAAWEDLKHGLAHFSAIERLAMVGEKKWQQSIATFCKPFTKADVRYFDHEDEAEARKWLQLSA